MTIDQEVGFRRFLIKDAVPFGDALPEIFAGYLNAYKNLLPLFPEKGGDTFLADDSVSAKINGQFFRYVSKLSNHKDPHLAQGPGNSTLRVMDVEGDAPKRASRYSLIFSRMFSRAQALTAVLRRARENLPARREHPVELDQPALIYSPLFFCRLLLTSPNFLASEALAHAAIRAFLFEEALNFENRWNPGGVEDASGQGTEDDASNNDFVRIREIIRFDKVQASLRKLESFIRNRDNLPLKDATDFIVSHLLASKGLLMLRFEGPDGFTPSKGDDRNPALSLITFLDSGVLVPEKGVYQFDKPREVRKLPTAAELINELDGLPLAVPGASHIFQGGVRFTTQSGVVARLYGQPGIGKTSFALAIGAALAPLGTQTIYLSCEERTDDLLHRIRTLVPPFIKRTQSYSDPDKWFSGHHVRGNYYEKRQQVFSFLDESIEKYGDKLPRPNNCPPGLMPLLIVLDGVHEMFPDDGSDSAGEDLRLLIEKCQETGAFVIAMSAEKVRGDLAEFDYLVDIVASLDYAEVKGEMNPPSRLFNLRKTRRQLSRTGAHALELDSRDNGLTLYPHIDTFLDESRGRFWVEPNERNILDFLLKRDGFIPSSASGEVLEEPLVRISDRSQVLVMGRGSSGKSLLGLRLLGSSFLNDARLTQLIERQRARQAERRGPTFKFDENEGNNPKFGGADGSWFEDVDPSGRRILVISFLYQAPYYENLKKHQRYWSRDSVGKVGNIKLNIDVEHFQPGFISAEEFIGTVVEWLSLAEFEGLPFHGVMIDGIHNVFLQFPKLETSEIVWPALYEILRVRGVSVVTTHTYFDVAEFGGVMQDLDASRRRVAPLLHALVQSSDYVLKVHPISSLRHDESEFARTARHFYGLDDYSRTPLQNLSHRPPQPARYLLEAPGALLPTHVEPPVDWGWDRERGTAYQVRKGPDRSDSTSTQPPTRSPQSQGSSRGKQRRT